MRYSKGILVWKTLNLAQLEGNCSQSRASFSNHSSQEGPPMCLESDCWFIGWREALISC
jgi:hypothetical protein